MVYKKFIRVGGKRYGPYYYESYREDGKIKKRYLGTSLPNSSGKTHGLEETGSKISFTPQNFGLRFLLPVLLILLVTGGIFLLGQINLTGNVIGGLNENSLSINLKQGEFVPAASKLVFTTDSGIFEFNLESLLTAQNISQKEGNFYLENYSISGFGKGYGLEGTKAGEPLIEIPSNETDNQTLSPEIILTGAVIGTNEAQSGFGKDYLNNETYTISIDLSGLNLTDLKSAKLVYNETEVVLYETPASNESLTNETITTVSGNVTIDTIQYRAFVDMPVKWKKTVTLEQPEKVTLFLPKEAVNVTVKKIENEKEEQASALLRTANGEITNIGPLMEIGTNEFESAVQTGEIEISLIDNAKEYSIEYYTVAPSSFEENLSASKKEITISAPDELNYTNITARTKLPVKVALSSLNGIRLYHLETFEVQSLPEVSIPEQPSQNETPAIIETPQEPPAIEVPEQPVETNPPVEVPEISPPEQGQQEEQIQLPELSITGAVIGAGENTAYEITRKEIGFEAVDLDNDSMIEEINWIVPHLSNQTYELELNIINVQSYPTVGGNWTVEFTTIGNADLRISAVNETNWSNENEDNDLKFLEARCGTELLNYSWTENSVLILNYSCAESGFETSKVITGGKHDLEFDFGGAKAYAHNKASYNLTDGLVLWYHFNNDSTYGESATQITDFVGKNNASIAGNTRWNASGKFGGAYEFFGVSSRDNINAGRNNSLNNLTNFTWAAWVYVKGAADYGQQDILSKDEGSTLRKTWYFDGTSSMGVFLDAATTDGTATSASDTVTVGKWDFWAITYDNANSTIRIYKNGTEVAYSARTLSAGSLVADSGNDLYIGATGATGFYGSNASIDEVMIWNRSLSANEISQLYNISAPSSSLIIWDDSDSATAYSNYSKFYANYSSGTVKLNTSSQYCSFQINRTSTWQLLGNMTYNYTTKQYEFTGDCGYLKGHSCLPSGAYLYNISCYDLTGTYQNVSLTDTVSISNYSTAITVGNESAHYQNKKAIFTANFSKVGGYGSGIPGNEIGQIIWTTPDMGDASIAIRTIDLNNTGKKDGFVLDTNSPVVSDRQLSAFTKWNTYAWNYSKQYDIEEMEVADFNNDSYQNEIAYSTMYTNTLSIVNSTNGSAIWKSPSFYRSYNIIGFSVADLDKNGVSDLVVGTESSAIDGGGAFAYLYGLPNWTQAWNNTESVGGALASRIGDFDKDGNADFGYNAGRYWSIFYNSSGGVLFRTPELGMSNGLEVVDLNHDNYTDEVLVLQYSRVDAFRWNGTFNATFDTTNRIWTRTLNNDWSKIAKSIDLNKDGYVDEVIIGDVGKVWALDNNSNVVWNTSVPIRSKNLLIKDINNDGEEEIVVGSSNESVYVLNRSGAVLWSHTIGLGSVGSTAYMGAGASQGNHLAFDYADINNDGLNEFVVASYSGYGSVLQDVQCKAKFNDTYKLTEFTPESSTMLILHLNNDSNYTENQTYVYDFSGRGNNGASVGAVVNITSGALNKSYQFNGSTYITIPNSSSLVDLGDQTWSVWIWPDSTGDAEGRILVKGDGNSQYRQNGKGLYLSGGGTGLEFNVLLSGGNEAILSTATGVLTQNAWNHVVLIWNGDNEPPTGQFYVNGNAVTTTGTGSYNSVLSDATYNFTIGTALGTYAHYFKGLIDEVIIFNRSLTGPEAVDLYRGKWSDYNMTWNYTSRQWEFNRTFNSTGTFNYTIECNKGGYTTQLGSSIIYIQEATQINVSSDADSLTVYPNASIFYANYSYNGAPVINGTTTNATCQLRFNVTGLWSEAFSLFYNATSTKWEGYADGGYLAGHFRGMPAGNYSYNITCNSTTGGLISKYGNVNVSYYATSIVVNNNSATYRNKTLIYANFSKVGGYDLSTFGSEIGRVIWKSSSIPRPFFGAYFDCENKGKKDCLVVGDRSGARLVYYNSSFSNYKNTSSFSIYSTDAFHEIEVGDLNNDGFEDELIVDWITGFGEGNHFVRVFNESGNQTFFVGSETGASSTYRSKIAIGDLDNDGLKDDFVVGWGSATGLVIAYYGNGTQIWNNTSPYMDDPMSLSIGDLDNDGKEDDVFYSDLSGNLYVFNDSGTQLWNYSAYGGRYTSEIGDFDSDGQIDDIALGGRSGSTTGSDIFVLINNGSGTNFSEAWNARTNYDIAAYRTTYKLVAIDYDFNGYKNDLIIGNSEVISAYSSNATAGFNLWNNSAPLASFEDDVLNIISVYDFDNDGNYEIFVADTDSNTTFLINNSGATIWSYPFGNSSILGGEANTNTFFSDLNRDGIIDMFTIEKVTNKTYVMQDAMCTVAFNDSSFAYNMTWNDTSRLWELNRNFNLSASYTYNVTCSKGGYTHQISSSQEIFIQESNQINVSSTFDAQAVYPNFTAITANYSWNGVPVTNGTYANATCNLRYNVSGGWSENFSMIYNSTSLKWEVTADGSYLRGRMRGLPVGNYSLNITCDSVYGFADKLYNINVTPYATSLTAGNDSAQYRNKPALIYANFSRLGGYGIEGLGGEIGRIIWTTGDIDTNQATYGLKFIDFSKFGKRREVAISTGTAAKIHLFYSNGSESSNETWPGTGNLASGGITDLFVADLDNDSYLGELGVEDWDNGPRIFNSSGSNVFLGLGSGYYYAIAVADLDNDGIKNDFISAVLTDRIYAYNSSNGVNFTLKWNTSSFSGYPTEITVADYDHDGFENDVVITTNDNAAGAANVQRFNESGDNLWNYTLTDQRVLYGVAGDFDNDGYGDDFFAGGLTIGHAINESGGHIWNVTIPSAGLYKSNAMLTDLDNDGKRNDIVIEGDDYILGILSNSTLFWNYTTGGSFMYSASVGDINSDGQDEIIAGGSGSELVILNRTGSLIFKSNLSLGAISRSINQGGQGKSTSTDISDLNDDGIVDYAVAYSDGYGYVFQDAMCTVTFNDSYWINETQTFDNSSLVALWHLNNQTNENATRIYDWSGNQRNATVMDRGNIKFVSNGRFLGGYYFNTTSAADGSITTNLNMTYTNKTISAWFMANSSGNHGIIGDEIDGGAASGFYGYSIYLSGGSVYGRAGNVSTARKSVTGPSYNTNTWYHVTLTQNDTSLALYVNGNLSGTTAIQGYIYSGHKTLIGKRNEEYSYYFNGTIDEVAVWNRSLSPSEVYDLYAGTAVNYNMTWNTSSRQWEFNRTFNSTGTYTYNVTCLKNGYISQASSLSTIYIQEATQINVSSDADSLTVYPNASIFYANYSYNGAPVINGTTTNATCQLRFNVTGLWSEAFSLFYNATSTKWEGYADGGYLAGHFRGMPAGNYSYNITCNSTTGGLISKYGNVNVSYYATSIVVVNDSGKMPDQRVMFSANFSRNGGYGINAMGGEIGRVIWNNTAPYGQSIRGGVSYVDIDNDGNKDELITNDYLSFFVYDNNGSVVWIKSKTASGYAWYIESGDFDHDGYQDDFASGEESRLVIYNNSGNIWFNSTLNSAFYSIDSSDTNNDGMADLIAVGTSNVSIFNYTGTTWQNIANFTINDNTQKVSFGDFSGDGIEDEIAVIDRENGDAGAGDLYVIYSNGSQMWSALNFGQFYLYDFDTCDLNRDGYRDSVAAGARDVLVVFNRSGSNVWNASTSDYFDEVTCADMDNSGYKDDLVFSDGANTVAVNSSGTKIMSYGLDDYSVSVGDVNGNGWNEVVLGSLNVVYLINNSGNITSWSQNITGQPGFDDKGQSPGTTILDINKDGIPDIGVTTQSTRVYGIQDVDCKITFNDSNINYNMTWNSSSKLWEFNRTFNHTGNYNYTLNCSKNGYVAQTFNSIYSVNKSWPCDDGSLNTTCYINSTVGIDYTNNISGAGNLVLQTAGSLLNDSGISYLINLSGNFTILNGGNISLAGRTNVIGSNLTLLTDILNITSGGKIFADAGICTQDFATGKRGGILNISANTVYLDGNISVNGGNLSAYSLNSNGGNAGELYLTLRNSATSVINGSISAVGGGASTNGGCSGRGREGNGGTLIINSSGNITLAGSIAAFPGGIGTCTSDVWNSSLISAYALVFAGNSNVKIAGLMNITNSITIEDGARIGSEGGEIGANTNAGNLTIIASTLNVSIGGTLSSEGGSATGGNGGEGGALNLTLNTIYLAGNITISGGNHSGGGSIANGGNGGRLYLTFNNSNPIIGGYIFASGGSSRNDNCGGGIGNRKNGGQIFIESSNKNVTFTGGISAKRSSVGSCTDGNGGTINITALTINVSGNFSVEGNVSGQINLIAKDNLYINNLLNATRAVSTGANGTIYLEYSNDLNISAANIVVPYPYVGRNNTFGKVKYTQQIINPENVTWSTNLSITSNLISVDSVTSSQLNKTADIWIYGLALTNPLILRNGAYCSDCVRLSYSAVTGIINFNVTGFTNYSVQENQYANITFIYPVNTSTHFAPTITFNVSVANDDTNGACFYSLDGAPNASMSQWNATFYYTNYSGITHGYHNLTVACNDTLADWGSSTMNNFEISLVNPNVTLITIPPIVYSNSTFITINLSNTGPPNASNVNVSCYLDDVIFDSKLVNITGYSSMITNCTKVFTSGNNQILNVTVDPNKDLLESDETDNTIRIWINVTELGGLDAYDLENDTENKYNWFSDEQETIPDQNTYVFANYTMSNSSQPVTGATCNVSFSGGSETGSRVNMSYNSSSGLYYYNRTFSYAGNYSWNVSCMKVDYQNATSTGELRIRIPLYNQTSIGLNTRLYTMNYNETVNFTVNLSNGNIDQSSSGYNLSSVWVTITKSDGTTERVNLSGNSGGGIWNGSYLSTGLLGDYKIIYSANLTNGFNVSYYSESNFSVQNTSIAIITLTKANTTDTINVMGTIKRTNGTSYWNVSNNMFIMKLNNVTVSSDTFNHTSFAAGNGSGTNVSNIVQLNLSSEGDLISYTDDFSTTKYTTDSVNYSNVGFYAPGGYLFEMDNMVAGVGNVSYNYSAVTSFYEAEVYVDTVSGPSDPGGNTSILYSYDNSAWTVANSTITSGITMTASIPVSNRTGFYVMLKSDTTGLTKENPITRYEINYSNWNYSDIGNYTSPSIYLPNVTLTLLKWTRQLNGGDVRVQLRESDDNATWGDWSENYTNYLTNDITTFTKDYIQYRAWISTTNRSLTPKLYGVQILYFNASTNSSGGYSYNITIPTNSLGTLPLEVSINQQVDSGVIGANTTNMEIWARTQVDYSVSKNYSGSATNYSVTANFSRSDTGYNVNGTINITIINATNSSWSKTCSGNYTCTASWSIPGTLSFGNYSVNITAYNESAYYLNSTAYFADYLEAKNTSGSLYVENKTIGDFTVGVDYLFYWNATVNNTGNASMSGIHVYDYVTARSAGVKNITEVTPCSTLYPGQSCDALMLITMSGTANVGIENPHFISWRANWTDNDGGIAGGNGYISYTDMYVRILGNASINISLANKNLTVQHESSGNFTLTVNAIGSTAVSAVRINFTEGNITADTFQLNLSWVNITPTYVAIISAGANTNATINVTIPAQTPPGNYTGQINVTTANAGSKLMNLTVVVPTNGSWYVAPSTNLTYNYSFSLNNAGEIANYTIVNTGNINISFNLSYIPSRTNDFSAFGSALFERNYSVSGLTTNPTNVTVPKGTNLTVTLFQKGRATPLTDVGVNTMFYNETASPSTLYLQEVFTIEEQAPSIIGLYFYRNGIETTTAEQNSNFTIKVYVTDDINLNTSGTFFNVTYGGATTQVNATITNEVVMNGILYIGANFTANYTPAGTGLYNVKAIVGDASGRYAYSNQSNFTSTGSTTLTLAQNRSSFTTRNINLNSKETIYINYTVNNTGTVTGYNSALNLSRNSTIVLSPSNITFGDLLAGNNISQRFQVNISPLTAPGEYTMTATLSWRDPNTITQTTSQAFTFTILSNKSFSLNPESLTTTTSSGSTNYTNLEINNTGNDVLTNVSFSCYTGDLCSIFTLAYNESAFNMQQNTSKNINISVTAPSSLPGGSYVGLINVTERNISKTFQLTATVPNTYRFNITPTSVNATRVINTAGNLEAITISNIGNMNLTFNLSSSNFSIVQPNMSYIFVQYGTNATVMINFSTPSIAASYVANIMVYNGSADTTQLNVTVNLTASEISIDVISPNSSSPQTNITAGQTLEVHATAAYGATEITSGANWTVNVSNATCDNINYTYSSSYWNITCTSPSLADGRTYNITMTVIHATYGTFSEVTENATVYRDITPPYFNITRNHINLNEKINLSANVTDNVAVETVIAYITYPNASVSNETNITTVVEVNMTSSNNLYNYSVLTLNVPGEYSVNYSANDTTGNTNSTVDWFEVYSRYILNIVLKDYSSTAVSGANVSFYRSNTSYLFFNNLTNDTGEATFYVNRRAYDLAIGISTDKLIVRDLNVTNFTTSNVTINLYRMAGTDLVETIPLYKPLYGLVSNATGLNNSVTLMFNYTGLTYDSASKLRITKCPAWNYTNRSCSSTWSALSTYAIVRDTTQVTGNSSGLSGTTTGNSTLGVAYFLAENKCGNGLCETTYSETTSTCVSDCPAASAGGVVSAGGGGSSGGGGTGLTESDLQRIERLIKSYMDVGGVKIETTSIYKELFAGETTTFRVRLVNTLNTKNLIALSAEGDVKPFIFFEQSNVEMEPNENKDVMVKVIIPKFVEPGTYDGDLVLTAGNKTGRIPTTIKILSPEGKLLDVKIQPLTSTVAPGEVLRLQTDLLNLGKTKKVDVQFDLQLLDVNTGEIITRNEESFAVETSMSVIKNLTIPIYTKPGKYMVKGVAYYSNVEQSMQASSIAYIQVAYPFFERRVFGLKMWMYALFLLAIAVGFGIFSYFRWLEYQAKRFKVKVEVNKLPQPGPDSAFVGKIAETGIRAFVDMNKLQMHTLIAGATGSGKTVAAQDIIEAALLHKKSVIVFDPTAQWTGFLRKCEDKSMIKRYQFFDMKAKDTRAFNGIIKTIHDPYEYINLKEYVNRPGEITIFNVSNLTPKEIDMVVASTIEQIFKSQPEESKELKTLIVYDEVHRLLPKFGGSGQGFIQLERGAREFRKWGIGLVLISQVLSDFVGEIKANIGTEVQMGTRYEGDLERVSVKYGEDILKSVVREPIGTGMAVNAEYNSGRPYFISFRPLLHSTRRLSNEELKTYEKYFAEIEDMEYQISQIKELKVDTLDLELEIRLAKSKVKEGQFQMAEMYFESLRPRLEEHWAKLKKKPMHLQKKMISKEEVEEGIKRAKLEREKHIKKNPQEKVSVDEELAKLKRELEDKKRQGKETTSFEMKLNDLSNRIKNTKGKISDKDAEGIVKEINSIREESESKDKEKAK